MHITFPRSPRLLRTVILGAICLVGSFALGVETAGEVQTIASLQAGSIQERGDINGNGIVDLQDVITILEVVQGYKEVDPKTLQGDPTHDGHLTVDDALRLLHDIGLSS